MIVLYLFIVGLALGSFYTVIGLRGPQNKSIVKPRSHCPKCKKALSWYELIPVVSWIIQGGKCRKCHKKISIIYPLTELLTGFLFALAFFLYRFDYEFFAMLVISSLLVIIFVSDFKYLVILDGPLFISCGCILFFKYYFYGPETFIKSLISGFVLFLFMLIIKLVGDRIFKTESLGGGDIKLSMFFGFCLGIRLAFISLVAGCFIAMPYAVYYVMKKKEKEIPFGPFLIAGMLIIFLLQTRIDNYIELILKNIFL